MRSFHGRGDDPASFDALHELIEHQPFRLAYWRVAQDEINYRRFFDINDLAALRQENDAVFEATHRLVASLVRSGAVEALRIDHPDGLYDPKAYFRRLVQACGKPVYIAVEKIVAPFESVPEDWAVHGTTGYRFANVVNGLFVDPSAQTRITRVSTARSSKAVASEACLVLVYPPGPMMGKRFELGQNKKEIIIGRGSDCAIQIDRDYLEGSQPLR